MRYIDCGVTSELLIFVSHRSSAFLRAIRLIAFETRPTDNSLLLPHKFAARTTQHRKHSPSFFLSRRVTTQMPSKQSRRGSYGEHLSFLWHSRVFIGLLSSKGCPVLERVTSGMYFTESLSSNGEGKTRIFCFPISL
jgi:hypothetical protein